VTETPVAPGSLRRVIEASELLALDGASTEAPEAELRAASAAGGGSLLLLRFEASWKPEELERAFLLLDPTEGASSTAGTLEAQVSLVLEEWSSQRPSQLPTLGRPGAQARFSFAPPRTLRIDVTELLREWASHRGKARGLSVYLAPGDDLGARFSLGQLAGGTPRLDLYLRDARR
jgi:hypothetical protein